ncbi:MAG: acylphosphatase [Dongiaceae bacterium]
MSSGEIAVTVRIRGRVQGVWYRAWTVEEASRRQLRGWVRNRRDGSVEALFHGPGPAVREMIDRCRSGPPHARVEAVEQTATESFAGTGFATLPTE